jgi:hypothetical protein
MLMKNYSTYSPVEGGFKLKEALKEIHFDYETACKLELTELNECQTCPSNVGDGKALLKKLVSIEL